MGQSRICHLIDILTKSTKSISRFYPTDNRNVYVLGQETRAWTGNGDPRSFPALPGADPDGLRQVFAAHHFGSDGGRYRLRQIVWPDRLPQVQRPELPQVLQPADEDPDVHQVHRGEELRVRHQHRPGIFRRVHRQVGAKSVLINCTPQDQQSRKLPNFQLIIWLINQLMTFLL